jgi:hypothetical protein
VLTAEQIARYHDQGFLHIPAVFSPEETRELSDSLEWLMQTWASDEAGWTGPWRKVLMDEATEKKSKLVAMHDLQYYSSAWAKGIQHPRLLAAMQGLLGPDVEFHHSTMHVKPPETGHPFPMHQDWAFYPHSDGRYVDVLVHLDDTFHDNGEIRFLKGSHKQGYLPHITQTPEGPCTPHLPTTQYKLEDTVAVPAKAGDLVVFNINTIHGSYVNVTKHPRRLVRLGYRSPENTQVSGQSVGRPGILMAGNRKRQTGQALFSTEVGPQPSAN